MASVDVIIPSYQYGRYLRQCIESVLTQEHNELRVLVIDNASTDNSVEVARQLHATDPRLELVARKKNLGAWTSFNEGIDRAAADYMTFLCADDIMAPGFLSGAVSALERNSDVAFYHGVDACYLDGEDFPNQGRQAVKVEYQLVEGSEFIATTCRRPSGFPAVVRTSVQKQTGYFHSGRHSSDMEMLLRLALHGRVARTTAVGHFCRIHDSNLSVPSWTDRSIAIREWEAAFDEFFAVEGRALPNARRLHGIAKGTIAARAYWWAVGDLVHGKQDSGLRLLKTALKLRPSIAIMPPFSFLSQAERPLGRVLETLSEAFAWRRKTSN